MYSEILGCPRCKHAFDFIVPTVLRCTRCRREYEVREGIPYLIETSSLNTLTARDEFQKNLEWFESHHRSQPEPWRYSERAAEILKRQHVLEEVRHHAPHPNTLLDIGCSLGQLSRSLATTAHRYYAIDISPTAIAKAIAWWKQEHKTQRPSFLIASATALPFQPESLDLVICMDGLHGMDMTEELQRQVLAECYRALRPDGTIIFTDYMRPERFHEMVERIRQSPFQILRVHYLYDRLWYQVESWFRQLEGLRWVKAVLRNTSFARFLKIPSRLFGHYGSRHICIVAKKPLG